MSVDNKMNKLCWECASKDCTHCSYYHENKKKEDVKMQDANNKEDTIEDMVNKMVPQEKKETNIQDAIRQTCQELCDFLIVKNKSYGNSIFSPLRVFSTADTLEQINVRIDDKLSRLKRGDTELVQEDTEKDLIGYLILKRCLTQVLKGKG